MTITEVIELTENQSYEVIFYMAVGYKAATQELMDRYGIHSLDDLPEGELKDFLARIRDLAQQAIEKDYIG